jgi:hypothetical protein
VTRGATPVSTLGADSRNSSGCSSGIVVGPRRVGSLTGPESDDGICAKNASGTLNGGSSLGGRLRVLVSSSVSSSNSGCSASSSAVVGSEDVCAPGSCRGSRCGSSCSVSPSTAVVSSVLGECNPPLPSPLAVSFSQGDAGRGRVGCPCVGGAVRPTLERLSSAAAASLSRFFRASRSRSVFDGSRAQLSTRLLRAPECSS